MELISIHFSVVHVRQTIPHLSELQHKYKDKGVTFVGITSEEPGVRIHIIWIFSFLIFVINPGSKEIRGFNGE